MSYSYKYRKYKTKYIKNKNLRGGDCKQDKIFCQTKENPFLNTEDNTCCPTDKCDENCSFDIPPIPSPIKLKSCRKYVKVSEANIIAESWRYIELLGMRVPAILFINGTKYGYPARVSKGSNGVVYSFRNTSDFSDIVATKFGNIDNDIAVIKELQKSKCKSIIVDSFYDEKEKFIVMEHVSGTLLDLKSIIITYIADKGLNSAMIFIFDILDSIASEFQCLLDVGYFYTDIKSTNIFYRCSDLEKFKIILGDLGSAARADNEAVATYPSFERRTKPYFNDPRESDIVWGLGILLLDFLSENIRIFEHEIIKYETDFTNINFLLDSFYKKYDCNFRCFIGNVITPDPKERFTLVQFRKELAKLKKTLS